MIQIAQPFQNFVDTSGAPLDNGYVYIGTAAQNPETNAISVYWDAALTVPAAQPIRTINGYLARNGSPARLYAAESSYSITVRDSNRAIVVTTLDASTLDNLRADLAAPSGASLMGFDATLNYAVGTIGVILYDYCLNVKMFPWLAKGNANYLSGGIWYEDAGFTIPATDDTAAIQAAINHAAPIGKGLLLPASGYLVSDLTLPPQHGGILLAGEAYNSAYNLSINKIRGTTLVSNTATASVISCDGGGFYSNRGIRINGISLLAETSGDLIRLVGSPDNTQITNCTMRQNGTGGGVYINNCWSGLSIRGTVIDGGATSSTGLTLLNDIAAGQYFFGAGSQINGFANNMDVATSGTTLYGLRIEGAAIQSSRGQGVRLGSVDGVTITNTHFEFNAGEAIAKFNHGSARCVNIVDSNTFYRNGTTAEININAGTQYSLGWNINGNIFFGIDDGVTAIKGANAAITSGKIADNYFVGFAGATVGIDLGTVAAPNWTVVDNEYSSVTTPVANITLIGSYIQKNGNYSAITTTQVKTAAGALMAIASGVATTVYAIPSSGMYQVFTYQPGGSAAAFTASAVVLCTGPSYKITATNGTNMTLTMAGANVQVTQTLGSAINVNYVVLKIS